MELLENGTIGSVKVDSSQADALIRVLDTCVIKLEGGTDEDLKVLDEKPKDPVVYERKAEQMQSVKEVEKTINSPKEEMSEADPVSTQRKPVRPVNSDGENWDDDDAENSAPKKELAEDSKDSDSRN